MKNITRLLPIFLLFGLSFTSGFSQEKIDTDAVWNIITVDGNEFNGTIVDKNKDEVKINTKTLGVITIPLMNIKSMKQLTLEEIKKGEVWLANRSDSRYLWSPSSYGLKKGQGYYQNVWVLFNQVAYGVTDQFSIGAGLLPLFLFEGGSSPFWITPKLSIPISPDKFNVGAGALLGTVTGGEGSFGMAYGTATIGSRNNNMSLGLGYGYADGEWADVPLITLSGMFRTGRRSYFLTENYFLDVGDEIFGLISVGGRIQYANLSLDYGGFIPVGSDVDNLFIIPWLGVSIPFGNK